MFDDMDSEDTAEHRHLIHSEQFKRNRYKMLVVASIEKLLLQSASLSPPHEEPLKKSFSDPIWHQKKNVPCKEGRLCQGIPRSQIFQRQAAQASAISLFLL